MRLRVIIELAEYNSLTDSIFKMLIFWQSDSFRELFEAIADEQCITVKTLIITYRDMRIFPSSSCKTLGIWSGTELGM